MLRTLTLSITLSSHSGVSREFFPYCTLALVALWIMIPSSSDTEVAFSPSHPIMTQHWTGHSISWMYTWPKPNPSILLWNFSVWPSNKNCPCPFGYGMSLPRAGKEWGQETQRCRNIQCQQGDGRNSWSWWRNSIQKYPKLNPYFSFPLQLLTVIQGFSLCNAWSPWLMQPGCTPSVPEPPAVALQCNG